MTNGKIAAWTTGVVGAIVLGAFVGTALVHRQAVQEPAIEVAPAPVAETAAPPATPAPRAKVAPKAEETTEARAERTVAPPVVPSLPATEPQLHERLKPVLNAGARMDVAAAGFRDAEQFATVAPAARNTNVPFM